MTGETPGEVPGEKPAAPPPPEAGARVDVASPPATAEPQTVPDQPVEGETELANETPAGYSVPEVEHPVSDPEPAVTPVPVADDGGTGGTLDDSSPDRRDAQLPLLEDISARLGELTSLFERRLSDDRSKEEAFQRLYEDLEVFRGQAAFQLARPLFLELILLLDRLDAALASDAPASDPHVFLESVRTEVNEILARRAIHPVAMPEEAFDPKMQRAIEVVAAESQEQHNSIAHVVRQGYEQDSQLVRPADVVVRRYASEVAQDG